MPALICPVYAHGSKQHISTVCDERAFWFIAPGLELIELLESNIQLSKNNNYFSLKFRCSNYYFSN